MSSILNNPDKSKFTFRIYENFCADCKFNRKCKSTDFVPGDGVCLNFDWKNDQLKKDYEAHVLDAQATTIWLSKGKSLSAIHSMSKKEKLSVLTHLHFKQFELAEQRRKELLAALSTPIVEDKPPLIHYFECVTDEGKKVIYKRNTASKSYKTELVAFRNYLEKHKIKIIKEEIK